MNEALHTTESDGLKFFGQMSASISHELKNTISIMNESAGLLEDFAAMAERGIPMDGAKVKRTSQTIRRQIERTDNIIRNMNRFSHLVDEPFRQVETADFLRFVAEISRRFTEAAGVTVVTADCDKPLHIVTRPFDLHHLLWLAIQYCIRTAGVAGELNISPTPGEKGVWIVFSGFVAGTDAPAAQRFNKHPEKRLMTLLGARIHVNARDTTLNLFLPDTAERPPAEPDRTG